VLHFFSESMGISRMFKLMV